MKCVQLVPIFITESSAEKVYWMSLDTALAFVHIPKTAGQSFRNILIREFPAKERLPLSRNHDYQYQRLINMSAEERKKIHLVFGHMYYGVHTFFEQPFTYVTFLRSPVERIVSAYYYSKANPRSAFYNSSTKLSLEEHIRFRTLQMRSKNEHVRFLTGYFGFEEGITFTDKTVFEPLPDEALEIAKKNLLKHFSGIGLTEHFDESLLIFQQAGLFKNVYYYRENVTKSKPKAAISNSLRDFIKEHNALDNALYEFAKEQFAKRWEAMGPNRDMLLEKYRVNNRVWSAYYKMRDEIASTPHKLRTIKHRLMQRFRSKQA
jgi:hypothetical protein